MAKTPRCQRSNGSSILLSCSKWNGIQDWLRNRAATSGCVGSNPIRSSKSIEKIEYKLICRSGGMVDVLGCGPSV